MSFIGIDIGGSKIAAGLVDENGNIEAFYKLPTPTGDRGSFIEALAACVAEVSGGQRPLGIGIGVPGWVKDGRAIRVSNLSFLDGADIAGLLAGVASCENIRLDNDANCAAIAEYHYGAMQGAQCGIMLTLGTGVGGCVIYRGRVLRGANGAAGEIGHFATGSSDELCSCGRRGCFEKSASAAALCKRAERYGMGRIGAMKLFDALRAGDRLARKAVDDWLELLSDGVVSLCNIFDPDTVVIGGGVSHEGETICAPIREKIEKQSYTRGAAKVCVRPAALGNRAGIIGAALLVRED